MRLILMGPPGAGKGTQAEGLAKEYNLPHISTGEIFRANLREGTSLGIQAREYMDKGQLVPDHIVVAIVAEKLDSNQCASGFLLDGFPRTLPQGEALNRHLEDRGVSLDAVINIDVPAEVIIERLTGRRVCRQCGVIYHLKFKPSQVRGICDNCGSGLHQRKDDSLETVRERLKVYSRQTQPLMVYYQKKGLMVTIDGTREAKEVLSAIKEALKK